MLTTSRSSRRRRRCHRRYRRRAELRSRGPRAGQSGSEMNERRPRATSGGEQRHCGRACERHRAGLDDPFSALLRPYVVPRRCWKHLELGPTRRSERTPNWDDSSWEVLTSAQPARRDLEERGSKAAIRASSIHAASSAGSKRRYRPHLMKGMRRSATSRRTYRSVTPRTCATPLTSRSSGSCSPADKGSSRVVGLVPMPRVCVPRRREASSAADW